MIVVIADDLSGAAELANAAVQAGLSAEVQMRFHAASDADVICVDTETRSLSHEAAAARVKEVARDIAAIRPALVYKKCDSVLRGHVAAESTAIARVFGRKRVLLIPANPSRQRIIRGGDYFVEGIPLAQTVFANDSDYPRQTSRVAELLGNAPGIEAPDVTSVADLRMLVATVDANTLPAGGVDFFMELLPINKNPGQTKVCWTDCTSGTKGTSLFVCGSSAAWLAGQNEQCSRRGIQICAMPRELFTSNAPQEMLARWAAAAATALRDKGVALLAIGGEKPLSNVKPAMLINRLAQAVGIILERTTVTRVFLEGGATAAAVVAQLGLKRFRAVTSPGPGIGALLPVGHDGPLLLIKPGSYPWPEAVWPDSLG